MRKAILSVIFISGLIVGFVLTTSDRASGASESVKDFYKNNTVTLGVTFGPGGGTDAAARIMAANWNAVTGGTMVVKNIVGAGGILGMNTVYGAKPDGLTLGYSDSVSAILGSVVFKNPGVRFDATKLVYIGVNAIEPCGLGSGTRSGYESIEGLRKVNRLKIGAEGIDAMAAGSALMIQLFGLKDAVIVTGYSGMQEQGLALARGEIDLYTNSVSGMKDQITKGFVKKVVVVYDYKRHPFVPDSPVATELAKLTPEQETMYKILVSIKTAKPVFAPPGVPKEKVDYLREAFEKLFKLDAYINALKVRWPLVNYPGFHATGEEWTKISNELLEIPEADRDKFINLVRTYTK